MTEISPDIASVAAAARTAGIKALHPFSSAARWRATSDGQMDLGARAVVNAKIVLIMD